MFNKIKVVANGFHVTTIDSIFKIAARQVGLALGQSVKVSCIKNTHFHARCNAILVSPKLADVGLPADLPAQVVDFDGCIDTDAKLKLAYQALKDVCEEYLLKKLL